MDFFEHQERARRRTGLLVFFYVLAVALIMLSVYFAFAITLGIAQSAEAENAAATPLRLWVPELFAMVMAGTLMVVLGGTAYKVMSLSRGGVSVASLLGGRQINRNTADADERKMLNVVEEMAIAAGIPVPPVFLLDQETGINAFAAGCTPADAVIGVTRGAIRRLSRDELQGVIAHEFSHIFNGDMRLNIRLMGVLHGILLIGLIGYWLLRSSMYAGRARSSGKGKGDSRGQIAILGLALTVIGFVGVFFAKLIKSAVSRQREFLADAAAVQFTRNPAGIAGALKKIGGYEAGSKLDNGHAEEASHFFFANGLSSAWFSLMATHPPLPERIRRLDAQWQQEAQISAADTPAPEASHATGSEQAAGFADAGRTAPARPKNVIASVGAPQHAHLDYVAGLLAAMPPALTDAARAPETARAIIYCLLASADDAIRAAQMRVLEQAADTGAYQASLRLAAPIHTLSPAMRVPLADMAIATLKELTPDQYKTFSDTAEKLILADEEIDLFEYTLHRMMQRHLAPFFEKVPPPGIRYHSLRPLRAACVDLLSCLAYWSDDTGQDAPAVFARGMACLTDIGAAPAIRERHACGVQLLDAALQQLAQAAPPLKKDIMAACVACVMANDVINIQEAQVLRAIGDHLGCPIPPIMAGAGN